jgi:DNA-binding transcriptional regulator YiaG
VPNIGTVLKSEIARIARKELKGELEALKKASAAHRREIAALKRRMQELERGAKRSAPAKPLRPKSSESADGKQLRFSATRFASQRKKLGLSAADFGRLLGVSALSVYKWEKGEVRPRRAQLEAIAAARGLGKREATARLEQLAA